MDKSKFVNFISKYHLNGIVDTVKIDSVNRGLKVNFKNDSNTIMGIVVAKGVNFPEGSYGIYNTKSLLKMIGILQNEVDVEANKESLTFADTSIEVKFMLANMDIIKPGASLNEEPEYEFSIPINSVFIDKFIKSKAALDDSNSFALTSIDGNIALVLNYSADHNTDRIVLKTETQYDLDSPILFDSNIFKEILISNKDMEGEISISSSGLAYCKFQGDDLACKYYIVALQS